MRGRNLLYTGKVRAHGVRKNMVQEGHDSCRCPGALQLPGVRGRDSCGRAGSRGGRSARSGLRGSLWEADERSGPGAAGSVLAIAKTSPERLLPRERPGNHRREGRLASGRA